MFWCKNFQNLYINITLVFYCCVTDYHQLSKLKQHACVVSQFLWVRSWDTATQGLLLAISQDSQNFIQAAFLSGAQGPLAKSCDCWPSSVPRGFRTIVSAFSKDKGPKLGSKRSLLFCVLWPSGKPFHWVAAYSFRA